MEWSNKMVWLLGARFEVSESLKVFWAVQRSTNSWFIRFAISKKRKLSSFDNLTTSPLEDKDVILFCIKPYRSALDVQAHTDGRARLYSISAPWKHDKKFSFLTETLLTKSKLKPDINSSGVLFLNIIEKHFSSIVSTKLQIIVIWIFCAKFDLNFNAVNSFLGSVRRTRVDP